MTDQRVKIDYTNWRGERAERLIQPIPPIRWGSNQWHKDEQWLLQAVDLEKFDVREFAMKDIHSWTPVTDATPL